jgi:hypothetical protein
MPVCRQRPPLALSVYTHTLFVYTHAHTPECCPADARVPHNVRLPTGVMPHSPPQANAKGCDAHSPDSSRLTASCCSHHWPPTTKQRAQPDRHRLLLTGAGGGGCRLTAACWPRFCGGGGNSGSISRAGWLGCRCWRWLRLGCRCGCRFRLRCGWWRRGFWLGCRRWRWRRFLGSRRRLCWGLHCRQPGSRRPSGSVHICKVCAEEQQQQQQQRRSQQERVSARVRVRLSTVASGRSSAEAAANTEVCAHAISVPTCTVACVGCDCGCPSLQQQQQQQHSLPMSQSCRKRPLSRAKSPMLLAFLLRMASPDIPRAFAMSSTVSPAPARYR